MAIRRAFGFVNDATAGGSEYDDLVAGAIPDANVFWPVTAGSVQKNADKITRDGEVRGRRARTAPLPFKQRPQMPITVPAYRTALEKVAKKTLGVEGAVTGDGTTTPYTHPLSPLGFGAIALPAINAQLVRDDLNEKISGAVINGFNWSFPLDGEGTQELDIWGLYQAHFATAAPTPSYTGFSEDVFTLRDAKVFIDGSGIAVPDLEGFDFGFTNNVEPKHYAGRNVVSKTLNTKKKKLWYPAEMKLTGETECTYSIQFGNTNTAQELAHDFGQIQKFVFECSAGPLGGALSAFSELLRITIYAGEHADGGVDPISPRDDITARYEGGAFYSDADSADVKIEIVNDVATPIA